MLVIAAPNDRALAVLWHDEGKRGGMNLARMDRDSVFRAHILKHPPEPVVGYGRNQVRHDPELGATECRGNGVASERDRIGRSDVFLVAGRQVVGDASDIDIGLSDEEGLHPFSVVLRVVPRRRTLAPLMPDYSPKLFARPPPNCLR